jgi:hypothetical protein
MRTHRCTQHGLAWPQEAGPRAPAVSSSAAAAVRAPVVGLAKRGVRWLAWTSAHTWISAAQPMMARGAPVACDHGTGGAGGMTVVLRHAGRPGKGA